MKQQKARFGMGACIVDEGVPVEARLAGGVSGCTVLVELMLSFRGRPRSFTAGACEALQGAGRAAGGTYKPERIYLGLSLAAPIYCRDGSYASIAFIRWILGHVGTHALGTKQSGDGRSSSTVSIIHSSFQFCLVLGRTRCNARRKL